MNFIISRFESRETVLKETSLSNISLAEYCFCNYLASLVDVSNDDTFFGVGLSNMYEEIKTDETASVLQKSQEGNYWDSFLKLNMNYDKRNQKFQTSSGFKTFYSLDLPVISDTNTLKNYLNYSKYFSFFDKNFSSFSVHLKKYQASYT